MVVTGHSAHMSNGLVNDRRIVIEIGTGGTGAVWVKGVGSGEIVAATENRTFAIIPDITIGVAGRLNFR